MGIENSYIKVGPFVLPSPEAVGRNFQVCTVVCLGESDREDLILPIHAVQPVQWRCHYTFETKDLLLGL